MKIYLRGYLQRIKEIAIAVICYLAAIFLSYALFYNQLGKLSSQLSTYKDAGYSLIYVLNYKVPVENIAVFPDTDIQIYIDPDKKKRLTVSSIMKSGSTDYTENYLKKIKDLNPGELLLTENVAKKYNLNVGDVLYAEYSYISNLIQMEIVGITKTDYDFLHPNMDNDIGIVYLGRENGYEENMQCKYIVFSDVSQAELLATYPQVIKSVTNKSENIRYVRRQGLFILIFQATLTVVAFIISYLIFFSKSRKYLKRCFLKGVDKKWIVLWPLFEKIIFAGIPSGIILWEFMHLIDMKSSMAQLYFITPILIICLGTICTALNDTKSCRRG